MATDGEERTVRLPRTVVMVGLMGAGKSAIGRRLAARLGVPFVDADTEIEAAAGCSVAEVFARHGEAAFREGERRVMARLLDEPPCILAAGGGAFLDPDTRAAVREKAVSVWLKADIDVLVARTSGRPHRPLLVGRDGREVLLDLMAKRYPVYAEADITVESADLPRNVMVERVATALAAYLGLSLPEPPQ